MATSPTFRGFISLLRHHWFAAMSGGVSVPFAIGSAVLDSSLGTLIFACLAATAFGFASFRVWADERRHVVDLEAQVAPKLKVSFDETLGVVTAIEKAGETVVHPEAMYVRVRVDTLSNVGVLGCTGYIVNLWDNSEGRAHRIMLPQPVALHTNPFDVLPDVPRLVDFMRRPSGGRMPEILAHWPNTLANIVGVTGVYVFELKINAAGGQTHSICIEVTMEPSGYLRARAVDRPVQ